MMSGNKMMIRTLLLLILCVALAFAFAGCSDKSGGQTDPPPANTSEDEQNQGGEPSEPEISGTVMIAAAASLENALVQELIPLFNQSFPKVTINGTYDSSGKLQEQIEGGLGASIFFSAATKQMDALVTGGFIEAADVTNLLQNDLVLITSVNSATKVTSFENITDATKIAIGDPASVPAGQYAQEALTSLKLWEKVSGSSPSMGTNVTEVLNWVAEGSAEVGIVYATDARSMPDKVKVIAVAPETSLKTPVIYPVGILKNVPEESKAAATAFADFLKGGAAMAVFEQYGFKPAP